MIRLVDILKPADIFPEYQNTPIGLLLEYHNLGRGHDKYSKAQLLVGMCMDYRKKLRIPDNFSYIIRTGGANMRNSEFQISYAISLGEIRHMAVIGHNNCGMANLNSKKEDFIKGLVDHAGWNAKEAEDHFEQLAPKFDINNEIDFVLAESNRLKNLYPKITVAPLFYKLENQRVYQIES